MSSSCCPHTIAARSGIATDPTFGAVVPPIYLSTTYTFAGFEQKRAFDYSRSANPTRSQLADALAQLEGGVGAVITASGMSAVTTVISLLTPQQLLLVPHDCYGGSLRLFNALAAKGCFRLAVVDMTDEAALTTALAQKPSWLWLETPSNPLLRLVDIASICQRAKGIGAKVAVDNTFLSPCHQLPLALGADVVVHSTTKYLNGHSDVVGGAVITNDNEILEQLAWWANCLGVTGGALDSYLTLRGLRTLPLRMQQHQQNALAIAHWLQQQPQVSQVYYPGLPSHPQHQLALKQQSGFGGMLSFELKGDLTHVKALVEQLEVFVLAESLGGVESLIAHPMTMTHAAMSAEQLAQAGISPQLLRLSVGIEAANVLIDDLTQAFAKLPR